jgi:hypothetical protein
VEKELDEKLEEVLVGRKEEALLWSNFDFVQ